MVIRLLIAAAVIFVVAVAGLVPTISGPCRGYEQRKAVAEVQMQTIIRAVNDHQRKFGALPVTLEAILPESIVDPWGTSYEYSFDGTHFQVTSFGADRLRGGSGEGADLRIGRENIRSN
jgi:hypothetical protein